MQHSSIKSSTLISHKADSVFSGISTFGRLPYFPCLASDQEKYDIAFIDTTTPTQSSRSNKVTISCSPARPSQTHTNPALQKPAKLFLASSPWVATTQSLSLSSAALPQHTVP
ncbi:MAG: hypothetical protein Q9218_006169 [Villophora microphyllina]